MKNINQIVLADCFDFIREADDACIDLAVIDPPYFLNKEEWDTFRTQEEFLSWTYKWINAVIPKLKRGASFYVFNTPYNCAFILTHLVGKGLKFQNWLTWDKRDGFSYTKNRFIPNQETILFFSKGKPNVFNADDIRIAYESAERMEHASKKGILKKDGSRWFPNPNGKLCGDVWHITSERHKNKVNGKVRKMEHATPKPLDMIERIMKASSVTGDLVFDCFVGSGTTAIAAKKLNRNFLACDINEDFVKLAQERLGNITIKRKKNYLQDKYHCSFPIARQSSMDEIRQKILNIKPGNKFLKYIAARVARMDYRGVHKSQHNRYDIDKLGKILKAIHKIAGENKFRVPRGDSGMIEANLKDMKINQPCFYKIYQRLRSQGVIKAPDPLRKNFFVEFSRLGFIEKYNKQGALLDPFKRTYTERVRLSADGLKFLNAQTLFEKHKIFTEGVEKLLNNTLTDLVSAIDLSSYRRDKFYFEEYTLIFSDDKLDGSEKIARLEAWRSLSRNERDEALSLIKSYCSPDEYTGDKTSKRDYHNWRNETQQLMQLFKMTVYFQVYKNRFSLNTGKEFGIFEAKRSGGTKEQIL